MQLVQSMVWPWWTQVARALASDTQRVPCRQEFPGDPVAMVLAVPPDTVGMAAPVVAALEGAAVPAAAEAAAEAAEEAAAGLETAAVVRLCPPKKCNP